VELLPRRDAQVREIPGIDGALRSMKLELNVDANKLRGK